MEHLLTWHGHSAFELHTGSLTLLIDPFFEGNPTAGADPAAFEHVDVICITHDHDDHAGQALAIAKRTGATVVAMYDIILQLVEQGLPMEQAAGMNIGGTVNVPEGAPHPVAIKMVQAVHSSPHGAPAGFILTLPDEGPDQGPVVYHAGDTGLMLDMQLFGRFHAIDYALLPICGRFNMGPEEAAYACQLLGARVAVPMHWGTFPILEPTPERFARAVASESPQTTCTVLQPGESLRLVRGGEDNGDDCAC